MKVCSQRQSRTVLNWSVILTTCLGYDSLFHFKPKLRTYSRPCCLIIFKLRFLHCLCGRFCSMQALGSVRSERVGCVFAEPRRSLRSSKPTRRVFLKAVSEVNQESFKEEVLQVRVGVGVYSAQACSSAFSHAASVEKHQDNVIMCRQICPSLWTSGPLGVVHAS